MGAGSRKWFFVEHADSRGVDKSTLHYVASLTALSTRCGVALVPPKDGIFVQHWPVLSAKSQNRMRCAECLLRIKLDKEPS
jgi:hypothetical protein